MNEREFISGLRSLCPAGSSFECIDSLTPAEWAVVKLIGSREILCKVFRPGTTTFRLCFYPKCGLDAAGLLRRVTEVFGEQQRIEYYWAATKTFEVCWDKLTKPVPYLPPLCWD